VKAKRLGVSGTLSKLYNRMTRLSLSSTPVRLEWTHFKHPNGTIISHRHVQ